MNPDIGNLKCLHVTGFNEIRTLRFMFPNPGTNIPATKKPRKTKKTATLSNQTYLISGFGRLSGFGAEDRWFSGCGGWSVFRIWGFVLV